MVDLALKTKFYLPLSNFSHRHGGLLFWDKESLGKLWISSANQGGYITVSCWRHTTARYATHLRHVTIHCWPLFLCPQDLTGCRWRLLWQQGSPLWARLVSLFQIIILYGSLCHRSGCLFHRYVISYIRWFISYTMANLRYTVVQFIFDGLLHVYGGLFHVIMRWFIWYNDDDLLITKWFVIYGGLFHITVAYWSDRGGKRTCTFCI